MGGIGAAATAALPGSAWAQATPRRGGTLVVAADTQPRNLNPSVEGEFGVWQMLVELSSMTPGTVLTLNVQTAAGTSDTIDIVIGIPTL